MALRISVDLDGLRWADLFRFVDLARSGGIEADDQVDVITYGSDPLSVSLSARIYPGADAFAALDSDGRGREPSLTRGDGPPALAAVPPSAPPPGAFGYENSHDRPTAPPANGSSYPAFDDRQAPPNGANGSAFAAYQNQPERVPSGGGNGAQFPPFDNQGERLPAAAPNGQGFAGFETVFDRSGKEQGGTNGVDTPYMEEFARLQEGLIRPVVRRGDENRLDRG